MDDPASQLLIFFSDEAMTTTSMTATSAVIRLVSVLILVAVNGFFVAAEFAFVGVRRSRIESMAAGGSRRARRLLSLLDNLNAYLSASQLGITLASLGLGWLGEPTIARLLETPLAGLSSELRHGLAFFIAFSTITALHIVLGEQAPKLIGLERAEKVALAVSLPMQTFYRVFQWPIRALDWASARTVRVFGLHPSSEHASSYTEAELRQLIELSHKSGHLRADERRLINRVFEFSDTVVREAMVPRTQMAAISSDCNLEQLASAFRKHGYSRLPVYRESLDDVIGFLHSKDVMPYLLTPEAFHLEDVLKPPLYVVDTARLEEVLRQMQKAKAHFGFVVDEHGGVEGIITLDDLLEEIVGDISDEHDEEVNEQIQDTGDGTYMLDGALAVRDINKRLNLSLPESDGYTTIAGFLMTEAGHILQSNEDIKYNGLVFHIDKVEKRRVVRVRLVRTEKPQMDVNGSEEDNAQIGD
jgi:CBS domain containing-hemolysin-like protein